MTNNFIPSNTDRLFASAFITIMHETNNLSIFIDKEFTKKFLTAKEETNKKFNHIYEKYTLKDILHEDDSFVNFFTTLKKFHSHEMEYVKLYNNNYKINITLDKKTYYYMSQIIPEDLHIYTKYFIDYYKSLGEHNGYKR